MRHEPLVNPGIHGFMLITTHQVRVVHGELEIVLKNAHGSGLSLLVRATPIRQHPENHGCSGDEYSASEAHCITRCIFGSVI